MAGTNVTRLPKAEKQRNGRTVQDAFERRVAEIKAQRADPNSELNRERREHLRSHIKHAIVKISTVADLLGYVESRPERDGFYEQFEPFEIALFARALLDRAGGELEHDLVELGVLESESCAFPIPR